MSSTGIPPIGQAVGDQALAGLLLQQVKRIADALLRTPVNATQQVFSVVGTHTYTTPTNQVPTQLRIRMWAGGGAGGGAGTGGSPTTGGNGGDSIWDVGGSPIHAAGGLGGATGAGGAGGSGTAVRLAGAPGGAQSSVIVSATNAIWIGGSGGGPGGGYSNTGGAGVAGAANTGGGGSSGGIASAAFGTVTLLNPGGGAGEYVEIIVDNPAASYSLTVGAGGTAGAAGTGGTAGGAGGTGLIVVDEIYA